LEEIEKMAEAEAASFDAEVERIQAEYEKLTQAYNAKVDELRVKSNYKLLRAVVSKKEEEGQPEL